MPGGGKSKEFDYSKTMRTKELKNIEYISSAEGIEHTQLSGFFVDWPNPPSEQRHLDILQASHGVELAIDTETNQVVGFITVISDGILSAFIPLLEVLPEYQGNGIGKQLLERILTRYENLYILDVCCDEDIVEFYIARGFLKTAGLVKRNYEHQSGPS